MENLFLQEYVIRMYHSTWAVVNDDDDSKIKLGTLKECIDYCKRFELRYRFQV